jgi:hypothetical protein
MKLFFGHVGFFFWANKAFVRVDRASRSFRALGKSAGEGDEPLERFSFESGEA